MSIKHLFKTVALITVFGIITRILGFGFRIFLSRELGAELLGFYTIAISFFNVLNSLVSSGIPLCVSKKTSEYVALKKDKKEIGKITTCGIALSCMLSILAVGVVFAFKSVIEKNGSLVFTLLLIMLPAVLFSGIYSAVRGNLWGNKNYYGVCITEFIEQMTRVFLCFLFIYVLPCQNKVIAVAQSFSASVFIASITTFIYFFKHKQKLSYGKGLYKEMLKTSLPITGVRFAGSFVQPLISLLIPYRLMQVGLSKSQAVASLGVSMGMTFPLFYLPGTVVGSLAMALIPDISGTVARGEHEKLSSNIKSSIMFTFIIAFLFVPLFIAVGEQIGVVLFGNIESGILLSKGAIIMVPMSVSNITSAILNSLGLEVKSLRNYLVGSLFLFVSLWFLPAVVGGGMALVIGMGICTAIASLLNIQMINKNLKKKINWFTEFSVLLGFSFLCGYIGKFSFGIFATIIPMFISSLVAGILSIILFLILIGTFNFVDVKKYLKTFKRIPIKLLKHKKVAKINGILF